MKKRLNAVVSIILSVMLLFGGALTPLAYAVQGEAESAGYEIYPTPHDIAYAGGTVTLPETLPVIYGDAVDVYTKTRGSEAFFQAGITLDDGDTSGMALRVGVYGSDDAADRYFKEKNLADSALLEKTDAYQLTVNEDGVAVLGRNTDAAFYGLTTLKRILQQAEGRTVRKLFIKDYSDVALRGFIEGYYGNPWSVEDRIELMRFGGELKMNIYFYAPKDDPKHNAQWRELYTEEELEKISEMAKAGEESKCRFGFALHTFMEDPVRFNENYAADLQTVKAKFEQTIKAGVRQIALVADDAGVPDGNPQNYVRLMTDLTDWVSSAEMQTKYPGLKTSIPFCPNDYMGDGSSEQIQILSAAPVAGGLSGGLPQSVPMIMTCGEIWGHVSNSFLNTFDTNTGRTPFLWVNWPCSDNGKDLLVMGGFDTVLNPGVDPGKVQGIMLNPMQQSEPSEVAIFGNADYAWHIWPDKAAADRAWQDSFKYVDHMSHEETAASSALRELSKHMIYENVHNPFPESVELKPLLDAFKAKLENGTSFAADVPALKTEFQKLSDAASLYLTDGRERMSKQIRYWLYSWQDVTAAALGLLDALTEIETGDGGSMSNNRILSLYTDAQARYEKSKTYGYNYMNHTEYAKVGSQEIQPFVKAMLDKVADTAKLIMDPTIVITRPITNRGDMPEGTLDNMVDGKESTDAVFKNPSSIAQGEYVGVRFNRAIHITAVRFLMGRNGNEKDTFTACKLQYTENGTDWLDIADASFSDTPSVLEKTGLDLKAVGLRAVATAAKQNTWLGVREIYVNDLPAGEKPEGPEEPNRLTGTPFTSDNISIHGGALANIIDDSSSTFVHLAENPYKGDSAHADKVPPSGAIGLNFGKAEPIGHISITQDSGNDKMTNAVLEYSLDGSTYTKIADVNGNADLNVSGQNITAQYVRLRSLDYTAGWVKIFDFTVQKPDDGPSLSLIKTASWQVYGSSNANALLDGDDNTYVWYDTGKADGHDDDTLVGDYIGVDLGEEIEVGRVRFVVGADNGDKWTKYELQHSLDNSNWTPVKSFTGAESGKDIAEVDLAGAKARYVRLVNQEYRKNWVKFSEISITPYDPNGVTNEILYKSTDAQADYPSGSLTGDSAGLAAVSVVLPKGAYVGIALPRIREVTEIIAEYSPADGLVLEAGANEVEMPEVPLPLDAPINVRYVRLRNTGDDPITISLTGLTIKSNEVSAPRFAESNIGGAGNDSDARKMGTTGQVFDGNVSTSCKFCASQTTDQYVLYDLGRTRSVSSLEMIVRDSELDYIRNGKVQIAMDKNGPWTDVITIESDVSVAHRDCSALNAGWESSSTYPNYVYQSGTIPAQDARYARVVFTDNFGDRWLVINELIVNSGEYIPEKNPLLTADPPEGSASAVPSNLIDGDITTGFTPNMAGRTSGSLLYRLSEMTNVGQINLLQSSGAISNAKVEVRTGENEWLEIGTLSRAFNSLYIPAAKQNVFEIRLSWGDVTPTFYELLLFEKGAIPLDTDKLQNLVDRSDDVPQADEGKYDAAVLAEYRDAKAAAQTLLSGPLDQITQKEINDAYDRLTAAAEALADNGDPETSKAVLQGLLSDIAADEQKYTPESWQTYIASAAYRQAQEALAGDDVAALHAARTALTEEIKNLILRADRAQLEQLLTQIGALQQSDYTEASFAAFQTEVERIRSAMADENLTQADADKLLDELVAAKEKLVKKPSGGHSSGGSNTTTTTTTRPDGTKETTTVNQSTGTTTVTSVTVEGVKAQTVTNKTGKTESAVTVPSSAVQKGGEIALPLPPLNPTKAVRVKINLPSSDKKVKVSVPLQNASDSTVAVLVGADGTEQVLRQSVTENGKLVVELDGNAMIRIVDKGVAFDDVPKDHWAAGPIAYAVSHELFNGMGHGRFEPDSVMSRAMLATVLHRYYNEPQSTKVAPYADVPADRYYAESAAWASEKGIIKGTAGCFLPDDSVTREQLMTMLYRAAGEPQAQETRLNAFADAADVSPWAKEAAAWAVEKGIVNGVSGKLLAPQKNVSRAEVAAMLQRFARL